MATSSFTSSVVVNRKSAESLLNAIKKKTKPNTQGAKKIEQLKRADIKRYKFK